MAWPQAGTEFTKLTGAVGTEGTSGVKLNQQT
jgi:hypothetical protein